MSAIPQAVTALAGDKRRSARPTAPLEAGTTYDVTIAGLKTMVGASIKPYVTHFTTGRPPDPSIRFQKLSLINTADTAVTAVAIGPDHKLYAGTDDGAIL